MKHFANIGAASAELGLGAFNVNSRRPYIADDGSSRIIVQQANGKFGTAPVTNAQALLRYDEWKDVDTAIIEAAQARMVAIADLRSRNLEYNLGSIGVTVSLWQTQGEMTEADISMDTLTRGEKDRPEYNQQSVPVPIVHKDFGFSLRTLEASRRNGAGLDVTTAALAGQVVAETSEKMMFLGANVSVEGSKVYGYITHPSRITVDSTANWATATGAQIAGDFAEALAALRENKKYGPYVVYVAANIETALDADFNPGTADTRTIRGRLLEYNRVESIQVADFLPDNNVVIVQLTRDVVDLAIAMDLSTVQWQLMGGMGEEFRTMAVWVPRIKAGPGNAAGIAHIRPA